MKYVGDLQECEGFWEKPRRERQRKAGAVCEVPDVGGLVGVMGAR